MTHSPTFPNPSLLPAQGVPLRPSQTKRPRRRRHGRRSRLAGPKRPGRFFRKLHRLDFLRRAMLPVHLGEADWLLYRRRFDPYRPGSYKSAAYLRGFAACKAAMPKPGWCPL